MYQSANVQLSQAKKESDNKRVITNDVNQMVRNKMLELGLNPIMELDESVVSDNRNDIMAVLKNITRQPKKVYSDLFNKNELDDFYTVMDEFARKYLKGRRNLTANVFMLEWDKFKNGSSVPFTVQELGKLTPVLETTESSKRRGLKNIQGKERNKIYDSFNKIQQEITNRDNRIKELFKIRNKGINEGTITYGEESKLDDEIMKLTKEKIHFETLLKRLPDREKIERTNIETEKDDSYKKLSDIQSQIDDLNEEYSSLDKMDKRKRAYKDKLEDLDKRKNDLLNKELAGFGLRKKRCSVKNVSLIINPTKMTRTAYYPVSKNWSYM
jgi:hypothetical protein